MSGKRMAEFSKAAWLLLVLFWVGGGVLGQSVSKVSEVNRAVPVHQLVLHLAENRLWPLQLTIEEGQYLLILENGQTVRSLTVEVKGKSKGFAGAVNGNAKKAERTSGVVTFTHGEYELIVDGNSAWTTAVTVVKEKSK